MRSSCKYDLRHSPTAAQAPRRYQTARRWASVRHRVYTLLRWLGTHSMHWLGPCATCCPPPWASPATIRRGSRAEPCPRTTFPTAGTGWNVPATPGLATTAAAETNTSEPMERGCSPKRRRLFPARPNAPDPRPPAGAKGHGAWGTRIPRRLRRAIWVFIMKTGESVPFVNRTSKWGVAIATCLSVLSGGARRRSRLTDFLCPKVREIHAVPITPSSAARRTHSHDGPRRQGSAKRR